MIKLVKRATMGQTVLLLLELLPATQVRAGPAGLALFDLPTLPNLETFGQYPILQFGAVLIGFIVTVAGLLGWKKGEKIGREASEASSSSHNVPVAELHFDGPIRAIFEGISDIKGRQLVARLEIKDDIAALLSMSRNSIIDKMAVLEGDLRDCIRDSLRDGNTATENRTRDVLNSINSLHERVDEIIRNQAVIIERSKKAGRG
jgi:hypothetical protein